MLSLCKLLSLQLFKILKLLRPIVPKDPKFGQTLNPAEIVITKQTVELVVAKESFGATTSTTRTGRPYLILHSFLNILASALFIFPVSFLFKNTASLFSS